MATKYVCTVVGMTFRPPKDRAAIFESKEDFPCTIEREPTNRFDANAIKVKVGPHHIGYIGKQLAAAVAMLMDASGISTHPAQLLGEGPQRDVSFVLDFPKSEVSDENS